MLHLYPHIELKERPSLPTPERDDSWVLGFKSDGAYIKNESNEWKLLDSAHTHSVIESGNYEAVVNSSTNSFKLLLPNLALTFTQTKVVRNGSIYFGIGENSNPFSAGYFENLYFTQLKVIGDTITIDEISDSMPIGSLSSKLLTANAIKTYVDNVGGFNYLENGAVTITTSNLDATYSHLVLTANNNGSIGTINGHTLINGDVLIVNHQITESQNGVYVVDDVGSPIDPFILSRVADADEADELNGLLVRITDGNMFNNTYIQFKDVDTIDVDPVKFDILYSHTIGGITGSGITDSIAVFSGSSTLDTVSDFKIDSSLLTIPVDVSFNARNVNLKNVNLVSNGPKINIYTKGNSGFREGEEETREGEEETREGELESINGAVILQGGSNTGFVGIKTLTPTFPLDVNGALNANDYYKDGTLLAYTDVVNAVGKVTGEHFTAGKIPVFETGGTTTMILTGGPAITQSIASSPSHDKLVTEAGIKNAIDNIEFPEVQHIQIQTWLVDGNIIANDGSTWVSLDQVIKVGSSSLFTQIKLISATALLRDGSLTQFNLNVIASGSTNTYSIASTLSGGATGTETLLNNIISTPNSLIMNISCIPGATCEGLQLTLTYKLIP